MEITAKAKYIRITPRKLRLVAKTLMGLTIEAALDALKFLKKSGARPLEKVIRSALANAQKTDKKAGDLKIKRITIDEGTKWRKWDKSHRIFHEARITKRTSNIKVVLEG